MERKVLITGSNRGIGLGLAQKFLVEGWRVFAAMRHPDGAREAWELEAEFPGRVTLVEMDVTSDQSVKNASRIVEDGLGDDGLDVLINNAGLLPGKQSQLEDVEPSAMIRAFEVNVLGPLRLSRAFLPRLRRAPLGVIANISSKMGSLADNQSGGMYAYRTSKTALNMVTRNIALEFDDLITVALHPGWVKTNMGGSAAPTEVLDSAKGLYQVITSLKREDSGHFLDFRGEQIPW